MAIKFNVNNGGTIILTQNTPDGDVLVTRADEKGCIECEYHITAGDFVMLLNLYRYIITNDIQNDFINPYGKSVD